MPIQCARTRARETRQITAIVTELVKPRRNVAVTGFAFDLARLKFGPIARQLASWQPVDALE
jgi:hypothetical protein